MVSAKMVPGYQSFNFTDRFLNFWCYFPRCQKPTLISALIQGPETPEQPHVISVQSDKIRSRRQSHRLIRNELGCTVVGQHLVDMIFGRLRRLVIFSLYRFASQLQPPSHIQADLVFLLSFPYHSCGVFFVKELGIDLSNA